MAKIKVSEMCRIHTDDDSRAYRRADGTVAPEITIGAYRLRLSIHDAADLATALAEAVEQALLLEHLEAITIKSIEARGCSLYRILGTFKGEAFFADVQLLAPDTGTVEGGNYPGNAKALFAATWKAL